MLEVAPLAIKMPLTRERASTLLESLEGYRLYVAANRGPVHHAMRNGIPESRPSAGGLVTALSAVTDYIPITWVSAPSGAADRLVWKVAAGMRPLPGSPWLKYVPVSEDALNWSYRRFSNPVLWFLQHGMWDRLHASSLGESVQNGWDIGYRPVNEAFARVLDREMGGAARPIVLTHDYHLYLLPSLVKRRRPEALVQHFTHIPWPGIAQWSFLPAAIRRELHLGLLAADVAGFQTHDSVRNFLDCCASFLPGARVDYSQGTVRLGGRLTKVRAYPISIDPARLRRLARRPETQRHKEKLKPLLGERTIVRVDRMDPSKNIAVGFKAFGALLERRPDLVGRVRFLAFLVPSRENIPEYRQYADEVWSEVEQVNGRYSRGDWKPIEVFYEDDRLQAIAGMALAEVLLVNPIADGMNLVAKEGPVASERDAALVLSKNCGAYRQLSVGAIGVSPEDIDETATALERALEMPRGERQWRLSVLRALIEAEDLAWWVRCQLADLFDG